MKPVHGDLEDSSCPGVRAVMEDHDPLELDPNAATAAPDDASEDVNLDAAYDEIEYMDLKVPGKVERTRPEKKTKATVEKGGPKSSSLTSEMKASRAVTRVTQRLGLERVHEIQMEYASLKSKFGEIDYEKANAMIRNLLSMGLSQIEIRGVLGVGGYRLQRLYSSQAVKQTPTYVTAVAADELVIPSPSPLPSPAPPSMSIGDSIVPVPVLSSMPRLVDVLTKKVSAYPGVASRLTFVAMDLASMSIEPASPTSAAHASMLEEADVVLGDPAACVLVLPYTRHLKWMQLTSASVDDGLFLQDKRDFVCTRAGGCHGPHVAQHIIATERSFLKAKQCQVARTFGPHELTYRNPKDVTVGILGLGDVGRHVAKLVAASGFRVAVLKRSRRPTATWKRGTDVGVAVHDSIDQVVACADYVVNALPRTPATHNLLTEPVLHQCAKKSPCFIDLNPWNVLDEPSLVKALEHKWLSSAILDLPEPVPPTSQLWHHPRVTLTPRVSPPNEVDAVADVFLQNLWLFMGQSAMQYEVDWTRGY